MRITIPSPVRPDRRLDVDVAPAVPAGDLRRRLALLTGDARWAAPGSLLRVAGRVLGDDHPAGAPPLLPGAHVGPGRTSGTDVVAALVAGAHLAVLAGPLTGRVVAVPDGRRVTVDVPRARPGPTSARAVAPIRVQVRRRGPRVRARVVGGPGALVTVPPAVAPGARRPRRGRRVGRLPRVWRPGWELHVAGTVLGLRGAARTAHGDDRPRRRPPAWAWTTVAPALTALVLAAALRQPLLLLTAATGVVGLLGLRGGGSTPVPPPSGADDRPGPWSAPTDLAGDVAALRLATAQRLHDRAGPVPGDDAPWPADRTLVLTGDRCAVLGAARAIVLRTLGAGTGTRLVLRAGGTATDWAWTRWWDASDQLPGPEDDDVLVVADGVGTTPGSWRLASPRARLLVVAGPDETPPAWASVVLHAGAGDAPTAVSEAVADDQSRAAAGLAWVLRGRDATSPSRAVALGELPGVPGHGAAAVAAAWRRPARPRALPAPVGSGAGGRPAVLDLVRDGPHVLVAGTTGAGKSELLTTLVLGLALTSPPRRLAVLLVDFKGGTGLGPLAALPHVVDHVHDLDVAAAQRTLVGLRAEVRRRERLLAGSGRTDVADLDPEDPCHPGRLLVVVDELRALVDDLPDAAATLARLAAQGRALGVHLLLATQRPAGAVTADLRANVGLRIALRVAEEEDSRDVIGCGDAAQLDPTAPGAALVRVGARPPTPLHVARARRRRPAPHVRLLAPATGSGASAWRADGPAEDDVAAWVEAARSASSGFERPTVPWLPALPERLPADSAGYPTHGAGLLLAVADVPDEHRRAPVRWTSAHGPLLVLGGPGSGRSTTLLTVGTHALADGAHVHTVGLPAPLVAGLRRTAPWALGTTLPVDDVHRTLLLLDRLVTTRDPTAPEVVLLVDGLDAVLDASATHARGAGADLLTTLLRHPPAGVRVAATGPVVPSLARLAGAFGLRLVLPVPDVALDLQAGVPAACSVPRRAPGRAVAITAEGAVLCQVVLPTVGRRPPHRPPTAPGSVPVRIGILPESSAAPRDAAPGRASPRTPGSVVVPLGTGGDRPGPVLVDPARPVVVAGAPGTGRTETLLTLARSWARTGRRVLLVATVTDATTDGPPGVVVVPPTDALAHLDLAHLDEAPTPRGGPARAAVVVLVDDVDLLERTSPALADRLERLAVEPDTRLRLVGLATTGEHAAAAYRGPVAVALRARQVLVLDPHGPPATDLLGPDGSWHADPRVRPPGRGVLRRDRQLVRVQVHRATDVAPTRVPPSDGSPTAGQGARSTGPDVSATTAGLSSAAITTTPTSPPTRTPGDPPADHHDPAVTTART